MEEVDQVVFKVWVDPHSTSVATILTGKVVAFAGTTAVLCGSQIFTDAAAWSRTPGEAFDAALVANDSRHSAVTKTLIAARDEALAAPV